MEPAAILEAGKGRLLYRVQGGRLGGGFSGNQSGDKNTALRCIQLARLPRDDANAALPVDRGEITGKQPPGGCAQLPTCHLRQWAAAAA